jgi:hypothetical protein
MIWKTPTINGAQLKVAERTFVDALSSRKIKLRCMNNDNKLIGINNHIITTLDTLHSLITGPPGIIKFDKDGIAYTAIQNCAPYVKWIERNDPIGFAEHHTEQAKSKKLDKKFVASLIQQVSINSVEQDKSKRWTIDAKREHIRKHAKMNVPAQCRKQY